LQVFILNRFIAIDINQADRALLNDSNNQGVGTTRNADIAKKAGFIEGAKDIIARFG